MTSSCRVCVAGRWPSCAALPLIDTSRTWCVFTVSACIAAAERNDATQSRTEILLFTIPPGTFLVWLSWGRRFTRYWNEESCTHLSGSNKYRPAVCDVKCANNCKYMRIGLHVKSRVIRGIWTTTICWNFDRDLRGKKKTLQRFDLCSASYEHYVVRAKASLARVGSWRTDARTFVKANPALGRSLRDVVEE